MITKMKLQLEIFRDILSTILLNYVNNQDNSNTEFNNEGDKVTLEQNLAMDYKYGLFSPETKFCSRTRNSTYTQIARKIQDQKSKVLKQMTIDTVFENYKKK